MLYAIILFIMMNACFEWFIIVTDTLDGDSLSVMKAMLSEITPPSESSILSAESNVSNKTDTKVLNPMSTEPDNISDSTESVFR